MYVLWFELVLSTRCPLSMKGVYRSSLRHKRGLKNKGASTGTGGKQSGVVLDKGKSTADTSKKEGCC